MKRDGNINKKAIIKDDISHGKKSKEENIHVGGLITDGDSQLFLGNDTKNLIFLYSRSYDKFDVCFFYLKFKWSICLFVWFDSLRPINNLSLK